MHHYALDIYKCIITVHYYIHRVYTTTSIFTSFLFTYILVLSENSTYTFKYKIKVLSSRIAAVQISVYTRSHYRRVRLEQSLTQSMEHKNISSSASKTSYILGCNIQEKETLYWPNLIDMNLLILFALQIQTVTTCTLCFKFG